MTRKLLMVLVSVMVIAGLVLAGCAPEAAPPEEEEEEEAAPEEEEEEEEEAAPEVEVIKWDVQAIWPAGFMSYVSCEDVIKRINIASGGRLEITLYPSGAIVPGYEIFDAVDARAVDGQVSVEVLDRVVRVPVHAAVDGAGAEADYVLGIQHLIVGPDYRPQRLHGDVTGDEEQVALPGGRFRSPCRSTPPTASISGPSWRGSARS